MSLKVDKTTLYVVSLARYRYVFFAANFKWRWDHMSDGLRNWLANTYR